MDKCIDLYTHQGIEVTNRKMQAGERITISYSGLLAASGADRIFLHYGYGSSWDGQDSKEMARFGNGFQTDIDLQMPGSLNVCFRDSAGNWDNNSNENYSFVVSSKKATRRSRKKVTTV